MTQDTPGSLIDIQVTTHYLSEQSEPEAQRFVFSYEITITNHNDQAVQLINRHWVVTDGNEKTQVIDGDGVVGEQPVIQPQQRYRYSSGTILPTRVGSMFGHYGMETSDGEPFQADIPAFTLAQPHALH